MEKNCVCCERGYIRGSHPPMGATGVGKMGCWPHGMTRFTQYTLSDATPVILLIAHVVTRIRLHYESQLDSVFDVYTV